jgi:hypothetical protein
MVRPGELQGDIQHALPCPMIVDFTQFLLQILNEETHATVTAKEQAVLLSIAPEHFPRFFGGVGYICQPIIFQFWPCILHSSNASVGLNLLCLLLFCRVELAYDGRSAHPPRRV